MDIANSRFLNKGDPFYIEMIKNTGAAVNKCIAESKMKGHGGAGLYENFFSCVEEKYDIHNALVEAGYQVYLNDSTPGMCMTVMWDTDNTHNLNITGKRSRTN
jgi:hypothetical protein